MREHLFSVGIKDCKQAFFTVGVHAGGAGKDTSNTGVRLTHEPSGVVTQCGEERSQQANRKKAFARLGRDPQFQRWCRMEAARRMGTAIDIEDRVNRAMQPENLKIEVKDEHGRWVEIDPMDLVKLEEGES